MTAWTRDDVAAIDVATIGHTQVIEAATIDKMLPGFDIWDIGPVRTIDGATADIDGRSLWIGLSAPEHDDPGLRHDLAALRLLRQTEGTTWQDLGPLLDPERVQGSRQWAASAVLSADELWITYTATGDAGEAEPTFKQRLFEVTADVDVSSGQPVLTERSEHRELFPPDSNLYDMADATDGKPGFIKAFRDPFPFRDPSTGDEYVLFAASLPPNKSTTDFNGVVGIARRSELNPDGWQLLDPLLTADGVNNELERPHIVIKNGNFYLFFSTQARTFHPEVSGPTGLYGFVAPTLFGPYRPMNGHGVIFTNPPEEPYQAYSWLVLDDLTVVSFIDAHSLRTSAHTLGSDEIAADRAHFGGTIAPAVKIAIDGERGWITEHDTQLPD